MGYDSCETMWTRQRGEILKGLKDLTSPTPSQLYQRAIDEIGSYSSKSNTAVADFAVISHCVREFMNSLPEFLGDVAGPRSNYGNEQNAAGELRNVLPSPSLTIPRLLPFPRMWLGRLADTDER